MDMNTLEAIKYVVDAAFYIGLVWMVLSSIVKAVIGAYIANQS